MKIKNIITALLSLSLFAACGDKNDDTTKSKTEPVQTKEIVKLTDAQVQNVGLNFTNVSEKEISSILKLNGKIDVPPQNLVSVSIPMGGYLRSTDLLPGAVVKKGQVIATLEDQQYIQLQQDYLTTKVKYKTAEAEFNRQKELNISKASSDKALQIAESDFKTLQINLKALDENLKMIGLKSNQLTAENLSKQISVFSPIDGYVSKVNANIGKYLTPSEVLFELVNVSDIHLNLNVYEKDLPKLAIGQKLIAYSNNQKEKQYKCEIILIGHTLSMEKNTEVHCHFDKYDLNLVPGMYMNAEVELKKIKANILPEAAVVRFGNDEFVFVEIAANQFEMIKIETGIKENGIVEIINYSEIGKRKVVLNGAYSLLMKLKNQEEEE